MLSKHIDDFRPLWIETTSRRTLRRLFREKAGLIEAVETAEYVPLGPDTSRGPSPAVWAKGKFPVATIQQDPSYGMLFFDDFLQVPNTTSTSGGAVVGGFGPWSFYATQYGGLGTDPNLEGGVMLLQATSTNNPDGITLTSSAGWAGFIAPVASSVYALKQKMFFECRVAVGSITTAERDIFIGLTDTGAPAANNVIGSTTNTLATTPGLFGFHFRSTTNPNDVGVAYNVAGGTVQYPTNLQTIVNTTLGSPLAVESASGGIGANFVKLGFVFDPTPANPDIRITTITGPSSPQSTGQVVGNIAKPMIQFFVNGVACPIFMDSTMIQSALFPSTFLAPAIAYESRGTAGGGVYVDWIRCGSLGTF